MTTEEVEGLGSIDGRSENKERQMGGGVIAQKECPRYSTPSPT